jgi:hypothetical protein
LRHGWSRSLPADFDGLLELEEVGLAEEDLLGGGAEPADLWAILAASLRPRRCGGGSKTTASLLTR